MVNLLVYEFQDAQFPPERPRHLYQPVKASDGFVMIAPMTQANFESLSDGAGHPEWKTDPRFASTGARIRNWDEFMQHGRRLGLAADGGGMRARPAAGRGAMLALQDRARDDAGSVFWARGLFARVEDEAGAYFVTNPAFQMSGSRAEVRGSVPKLGEHADEVLGELLQYPPEQIEALRANGVIK